MKSPSLGVEFENYFEHVQNIYDNNAISYILVIHLENEFQFLKLSKKRISGIFLPIESFMNGKIKI